MRGNNWTFICGTVLAVMAAALLWPAPAAAQLEGICENVVTLESGDTIERTLTDVDYIWAFCFDGQPGDTVSVIADVISGDLEGFVAVINEVSEATIAETDTLTVANTPEQLLVTIPEAGSYIIAVGREGGETGSTTGTFSIGLLVVPGGLLDTASADCPPNTTSISAGMEVTGTITDSDYFSAYCFNAAAGDVIIAETEAASRLDTLLILTDATLETTLDENDDCTDDTLDSCIEFEIEADGTYVMAVGRYETVEGATTGDFTLTFDIAGADDSTALAPPGEKDAAPSVPGTAADCDSVPVSRLVDAMWEIDTDDLQLAFVFDCDGQVAVAVDGQSLGTGTYTLEPQDNNTLTLTIDTGSSDIEFTRVVVTPTTLSALLNDETFIAMTANSR